MAIAEEGKKLRIKLLKLSNGDALDKVEAKYKKPDVAAELLPWAKGTSYREIAEHVIKDQKGAWKTPIYLVQCRHTTMLGMTKLCQDANTFLMDAQKKGQDIDILSISARMDKSQILLHVLIRCYAGPINFFDFYEKVGDDPYEYEDIEDKNTTGTLIIPDKIKSFHYTEEEIKKHDSDFSRQSALLNNTDPDHPFLNGIGAYVPQHMPTPADSTDLIYDLKTSDKKTKTISPYEQFTKVFRDIMTYVNNVEYHHYRKVINNDDGETEEDFLDFIEEYIQREHVRTGNLPIEDVPVMIKKLHRSLFQLYIVQDLIDDPNVTDIKITAPDAIRARVKGKAYMSNISFIDRKDYLRFVDMIALRNRIALNVPSQTFTDTRDENYVLRFSITAEYVNSVDWPYVHIRKISRKKMLGDDLIKAGMFDEKIRDYLLDCGKTSRGVVFAGPPGCVDCETEFFDGKRWKSIADYEEGDQVLQYDPKTGQASLVKPERYIKEPCDRMYHFETKFGINQTLSPEHRVLFYKKVYRNGTWKWSDEVQEMSCEQLYQLHKEGKFYGGIRTTFHYESRGLDLTDPELKLMVFVILNGSFDAREDKNHCVVTLGNRKHQKRMESILAEWGGEYSKFSKKENQVSYVFSAPRRDTSFTEDWYGCNEHQFRILCDLFLERSEKNKNGIQTSSKERADFLQFAFSVCGYRSAISCYSIHSNGKEGKDYQIYNISFCTQTVVSMKYNKNREDAGPQIVKPEDGYKYCFTVPTHALVLRRKGRIFITGNSGKTVALNWFLEEAYEQSAEILVIQENDELFCYRKGVMFQHVVNYTNGNEQPVNLEQLGQLALVAGANVFIIGEAKGAEICSAITLSNSGCRTAITIHSPSSTETIDKMADLAMRGYAQDYNQAKRMLKSFQTVVYLEDFAVREISEIAGYDDEKNEIIYRYIYRKPGMKAR